MTALSLLNSDIKAVFLAEWEVRGMVKDNLSHHLGEVKAHLAAGVLGIDLLKKEVDLLKQQKKGLMQLLLTGKVRVKV